MSGGHIRNNRATMRGGGVCIEDYQGLAVFEFSGGLIETNISGPTYPGAGRTPAGNGVFSNAAQFKMSGSARVSADNDVYLDAGQTITLTGSLSGTTPVATITPNDYTPGRQILDNNANLTTENIAKFAVKPYGTLNYRIDSDGKLQTDP
jgi:hypothetical protein